MSLTSEMTALADAIREKSKKTEKMNISAMTAAVQSIQTGSGGGGSSFVEPIEKDVNFYDYDGVRLYSYTTDEAAALTELPNPQIEHNGLTFQEWNWTLDEIKTAGVADVGANYITTDGKTRLYITIESIFRPDITLNLRQDSANGATIDWGDGSDTEQSESTGNVSFSHTYANTGDYVISISVTSGHIYLGHTTGAQVISAAGQSEEVDNLYSKEILAVEIGSCVSGISTYSLSYCASLKSISISKDIMDIGSYMCRDCTRLNAAVIPHGVMNMSMAVMFNSGAKVVLIGGQASAYGISQYYNCKRLMRAICSPRCTIPPQNVFYGCISLIHAVFTGPVKTINSQAFYNCTALKRIDFSRCTAVPSLSSTDAFKNCPADMEIIVPASLLDEWKTATNWSVYADHIKAKEA